MLDRPRARVLTALGASRENRARSLSKMVPPPTNGGCTIIDSFCRDFATKSAGYNPDVPIGARSISGHCDPGEVLPTLKPEWRVELIGTPDFGIRLNH